MHSSPPAEMSFRGIVFLFPSSCFGEPVLPFPFNVTREKDHQRAHGREIFFANNCSQQIIGAGRLLLMSGVGALKRAGRAVLGVGGGGRALRATFARFQGPMDFQPLGSYRARV